VAPSDHFVEDEPGYASSLQNAVELVASRPGLLIVLASSRHPSPDYGWMLGAPPGEDGVSSVTSFVEKPEPELRGG